MPKKNLQVIYYLIALATVVTTGYITGFSNRWVISVLTICGVVLLITYIIARRNKHNRQDGHKNS